MSHMSNKDEGKSRILILQQEMHVVNCVHLFMVLKKRQTTDVRNNPESVTLIKNDHLPFKLKFNYSSTKVNKRVQSNLNHFCLILTSSDK